MEEFWNQSIAFALALFGFFAFPIIQFIVLKWVVRREGNPELWHLPRFGFRLVIRNMPNKRVLSDIRFRVVATAIIPSSDGASVRTFSQTVLTEGTEMFLFPKNDHILLSFRIEHDEDGSMVFVKTDKLGKPLENIRFDSFDRISIEYLAVVETRLNFDVKIGKRLHLTRTQLQEAFSQIDGNPIEQLIPMPFVRSVF
jgi:hypothetical protein